MNKESLKRLIECEKNAKFTVEEARRKCSTIRSKAEVDAKEVVDNKAKEYEKMLADEEKHILEEIRSEARKIEEETQRKIKDIRSKIPNLEEVADYIVGKIAFTNKASKTSQ
eukprot:jgi/Antlo1/246/1917